MEFGALDPLGFANSEGGHHADVKFPCEAGKNYFFFWNAEYLPGRHPFTVKEGCSGIFCSRPNLGRLMRRFKQQRTA
ncbi:MAG: hypothetical protein SGPRY_011500 [Prymnesium sp.]